MNHPTPQELAEFLYDEIAPDRRDAVATHIESCEQCAAHLDAWRVVRRRLQSWQLRDDVAAPPRRMGRIAPALRWSAAAVLLLASGFGLARWTSDPGDLSDLRADLARQLRDEVRQELATELARHSASQAVQQKDFQEAIVQAVSQLESRRLIEQESLRRDVETVALRTQQEFSRLINADTGLHQ